MRKKNQLHQTNLKTLLSIRDERQRKVYPNCHPTYNECLQKIIELIDWALEKYRVIIKERLNRRNK